MENEEIRKINYHGCPSCGEEFSYGDSVQHFNDKYSEENKRLRRLRTRDRIMAIGVYIILFTLYVTKS
jgi:hypothetical protein